MKPLKIIFKILASIIVVPLSIVGAILTTPFILLYLIFYLPTACIQDIWDTDLYD